MSASAGLEQAAQYQPGLSWHPYADLIRFDKPVGTLLLCWPCYAGTALVACNSDVFISPALLVTVNAKLTVGCFLVRSLGCAWNDIVDQDIDRRVARTRLRPIPRGAISTVQAMIFAALQLLIGVAVVLKLLPRQCFFYGIPSIILVGLYPLAKRVTYYPQVFLGVTMSWGVLLAFPALEKPMHVTSAGCLFTACTAWTAVYDTIYASQDVEDDVKIGVKSTMIRYKDNPRVFLRVVATVQFSALISLGYTLRAGPIFYLLCGIPTGILGAMVEKVEFGNPANCWWWFRKWNQLIGAGMAIALLGEYTAKASLA